MFVINTIAFHKHCIWFSFWLLGPVSPGVITNICVEIFHLNQSTSIYQWKCLCLVSLQCFTALQSLSGYESKSWLSESQFWEKKACNPEESDSMRSLIRQLIQEAGISPWVIKPGQWYVFPSDLWSSHSSMLTLMITIMNIQLLSTLMWSYATNDNMPFCCILYNFIFYCKSLHALKYFT